MNDGNGNAFRCRGEDKRASVLGHVRLGRAAPSLSARIERPMPCLLCGNIPESPRMILNTVYALVLQMLDPNEHPEGYVLEGSTPVAKADEAAAAAPPEHATPAAPTPEAAARSAVDGNVVIDILSEDEGEPVGRGTKRKARDDGAGPSSKAAKADDVIELD